MNGVFVQERGPTFRWHSGLDGVEEADEFLVPMPLRAPAPTVVGAIMTGERLKRPAIPA
jgi:hypothetical protein